MQNLIIETLGISIGSLIAIIAIILIAIWLFIKSAVKSGTKEAILEAYDIIKYGAPPKTVEEAEAQRKNQSNIR